MPNYTGNLILFQTPCDYIDYDAVFNNMITYNIFSERPTSFSAQDGSVLGAETRLSRRLSILSHIILRMC